MKVYKICDVKIAIDTNKEIDFLKGFEDVSPFDLKVDFIADKVLLENRIREVLSNYLPHHNGFLLHSAGLLIDDMAFLLCGGTGSGKTHFVRLYEELSMGDEIMGVRKIGDKFWAYSTPFGGEFPAKNNIKAEIEKVIILQKNKRPEKLKKDKALWEILKNVIIFKNDKITSQKLLDILKEFIEVVDVYEGTPFVIP